MAWVAAFELATAPAEPQAVGVIVTGGANPTAYTFAGVVVSFLPIFRPPDPGYGYAY